MNGVEWSPDTVCVFDGLQDVIERCAAWYEDRSSAERANEILRAEERASENKTPGPVKAVDDAGQAVGKPGPSESGVELHIAEPIVDRKSVFVGRACRVTSSKQVSSRFKTCHL